MRTLSLWILLSLSAALLAACGAAAPEGGAASFSLELEPNALTLQPGESAEVAVAVTAAGGFSGPVTVTLENPPAGVFAEPVIVTAASSRTMTVSVGADAPAMSEELTLRGVRGNLASTAQLVLTVQAGPGDGENGNGEPGNGEPGNGQPGNGENGDGEEEPFSLLVFTKTNGWRHNSIPAAVSAVEALGAEHGFTVTRTEDGADFSDENLANYAAVMFLLTSDNENTPEDVLNDAQKAAFERFIRAGGGYAGVHSASDTAYNWPWYQDLVGAWFDNHPMGDLQFQEVDLIVEDGDHPSTRHLGAVWTRTDEWYNFRRNPREVGVTVLLRIDTDTFQGSDMGEDHPIAWYRDFEGGRSWYTGLGHSSAHFSEPEMLEHLLGGILYAAGRAE